MRIVIIGNSGSGKTWLAKRIAGQDGNLIIHLDNLFWEPGGFNRKRPPEVVDAMIRDSLGMKDWIAEGVFGELAKRFLPFAQGLILLDMQWELCRSRLIRRGSESRMHLDREESGQGLRKLVRWAGKYWERTDMRSHIGHGELFGHFSGPKVRLTEPESVELFLAAVQQAGAIDAIERLTD